jgi:thioredoxin reductase (NADPH)
MAYRMKDKVQFVGAGAPETGDRDGAFPRLDEDQRARLLELGRLRTVEAGEVLFAAGDVGSDFFVIESGAVAIVQGLGQENRLIAVHGQHRFLGELGLLTGQRLYLSGVVRDPGQVIEVPIEGLRQIVAEDKTLSDLILGAFIARRSILIDIGTGIKLIGSRFSPDSRRLREFLARNRMPHQWIDLEQDQEADALLSSLAIEPDQTPVVIASGGEILRNPSNAELGRSIGLGARGSPPALCDVLVVGAGPAGLAASLYAASEGLYVQCVEAVASGGQAGTSARIENYLGFPAGISGSELAQRAGVQALKFGSRLAVPAAALAQEHARPARDQALERRRGDRPHHGHRHRSPVPSPRRRAARGVRRGRGLLRRHPGRRAALQRRSGCDRRRRKLSRPGGDVPFRPSLAMPPSNPRR